ncbi:hypothetical protein ACWGLF_03085 [Streptomyces puniciscabiei]
MTAWVEPAELSLALATRCAPASGQDPVVDWAAAVVRARAVA